MMISGGENFHWHRPSEVSFAKFASIHGSFAFPFRNAKGATALSWLEWNGAETQALPREKKILIRLAWSARKEARREFLPLSKNYKKYFKSGTLNAT